MRLKDKIAIVTGAASGFGEGIARRYAAAGARVVVADLNLAGAEQVARAIGNGPMAMGRDMSTPEDSSSFTTGMLLPVDGGRAA